MITDSFDPKSKPIISLRDFYGEQKFLSDVCIITFSKDIFESLLKREKCEKIGEIPACNGNMPIYSFYLEGKKIAFYLSPLGSTMASETLLEANWLIGAPKFIVFGSSGSLDQEKTNNRFVIPTDAYRDEGMSYHYLAPSDYVKIKNANIVKSIFDEIHIPYVLGKTWTTDAILRETVDQMKKRKEEGCLTVEMELAGLQAVSDFAKIELFAFLVTGDVLNEDSYSLGSLKDANNNVDKLDIALEIAKRI